MKARIKKTGEIINIASYAKISLDKCDSWGDPIKVKPEDIELIQEQTEDEHWQDIRERAAIAAMQGVMNFFGSIDYNKETIAKAAVEQADALIEELEKQGEQKSYASETMNEKGNFDSGFTRMMKKGQKPAWSEEDDNCLSTIIAEFSKCTGKSVSKDEWMRCNDFLNSLKDRVLPQPNQEWSEEDENMRGNLLGYLNGFSVSETAKHQMFDWLKSLRLQKQNITNKDFEDIIREIKTRIAQCNGFNRKHREEVFNLLDSLRPQNTWKPDGDQLDALYDMIRSFKKESSYTNRDDIANIVDTLLEQLEAL